MSTTTEQHTPAPARPPFVAGTRVFWPLVTWPSDVAIGEVLDPTTPDVGPGPSGTTPVLCAGTVRHVLTDQLRALPLPVAPTAA